jgi:hypothetical protein
MTSDPEKLTCAEFQAQLPDLISSGEDARNHPHLKSCQLCQALLADLETIAEAARQLFPGVEPPDEVWEHIESALKTTDDKSEDDHAPKPKPGAQSESLKKAAESGDGEESPKPKVEPQPE